jgi:hypothetical protein
MERTMTTSVSHGGYAGGGQDEIFVIFIFGFTITTIFMVFNACFYHR